MSPFIELPVPLQDYRNDLAARREFFETQVLAIACVNDLIHDVVKYAVHQIVSGWIMWRGIKDPLTWWPVDTWRPRVGFCRFQESDP